VLIQGNRQTLEGFIFLFLESSISKTRAVRNISTVFAVSAPAMEEYVSEKLKLVDFEPDTRDFDVGFDGKRCGIDVNGTAYDLRSCVGFQMDCCLL